MLPCLSTGQLLLLRLRAQQLAARTAGGEAGAAQVVRGLCGVQAQDAAAAALSIRVRCMGLVEADVERAQFQERSIVRTWCMRGTLHLVAAEDVGWLLGLLGPLYIKANRGRRAELGLDEGTGARGVRALRDVLARSGPLTRAEIVEQLAERGIRLIGQARPHLLMLAALEGVVCVGPNRGREPTYVLLDDWIDPGPALPREEALVELARRYLSAYAPAMPEDFATWSGLPLGQARSAWQQLAGRLIEVTVGGLPAWLLEAQARRLDEAAPSRPIVRLLPRYDTYLLGYRRRDVIVSSPYTKRIYPGGGLLHPALLVDGRAAGTWDVRRRRDDVEVTVEPFEELEAEVWRSVQEEVAELGHFWGGAASLRAKTSEV